jgi:hypothetical protein
VVAGAGTQGVAAPADSSVAENVQLNTPVAVVTDNDGHLMLTNRGTHTIHVVDPGGDGVVDGDGDELIYRIAGGGVPTPGFCGDPDPGAHNGRLACLNTPGGLAWDEGTTTLYLADEANDRVRKIPSDCDLDGLADGAEIAVGSDPCVPDTDSDGCTDGKETSSNPSAGGGRRPAPALVPPYSASGFWDFYDVWTHPSGQPTVWQRTKVVDVDDLISAGAVTSRFATAGTPAGNPLVPPVSNSGYHVAYDRTFLGPDAWDLGPPDGAIGIDEVFWAVAQFAHNCN